MQRNIHWMAPAMGTVKINIDGAFRASTGTAGIGVLCRNNKGDFLGSLRKTIQSDSPFMSECIALKEALLHRGKFLGSPVVIETDCKYCIS
ncbi:hypothetical protein QN277_007671 [Acacia crassicarpa]|uniref:RNase H type-1 domain-containing protein n=1 Tax=Acacia crassicarpa TaxID=499986 RepID=A0AAE1IVL1_9FABA|nr:hypothetical protein QN277_007671 [Acacia crassicarpa]